MNRLRVHPTLPASLQSTWRDVVFAARQLRRAPVFAAGVVLSLAFGIGSSATVCSWIQSMLLRPLPGVRAAGRLVSVRPELRNGYGVSLDEYVEWRDQARSFSGLAASSLSLFSIQADGNPFGAREPLFGVFASANYFHVLGVVPAHGRAFVASDDAPGAAPVAVLSDAAWRRYFNQDPAAVGQTVRINGRPVRIIGIAPPRFGGTLSVARFDIWLPLHARPALMPGEAGTWTRRDYRWLDGIGRLAPGVSLERAHEELQAIARGQAERFEENRGRGARVTALDIGTVQRLEPHLLALAAVTVLLVILICSNVATLLLTRAAARERELAVRLSLGAARRRLIGQVMVECSLLAVLGAGLGVVIAAAYGDALLAALMPDVPVGFEVHSVLDGTVLGVVVAVTLGCVLTFGLPPALLASGTAPAETLKRGVGYGTGRGGRLRATLVVAQFALALAILVGAAVFLRRDRAMHAMDLGYRDGEHILMAQSEMSLAGYDDVGAWARTTETAAERITRQPGVRAVALASFVPLSVVGYSRQAVRVPGYLQEPGAEDRVLVNAVSEGYFDLMGVPLLEGRGFTWHDTPDQPPVVVVNQGFAERYFAGVPPLGKAFTLGEREVEIVGVARNGRYDYRDIDNASLPLVYYAWRQAPNPRVTFHVRTEGDPAGLAAPVRTAILESDPAIVLLPLMTLREAASVPFAVSRSALGILAVLGLAGLLLASMGLFSVVSYGVSLRTREIGIRVALGATGPGIAGLILGSAARLIAAGSAVGVVAALALTGALRSRMTFLPDARVAEYLLPALILAGSALLAGLLPARRAARVDPARTLRTD
jgi:predicted permease